MKANVSPIAERDKRNNVIGLREGCARLVIQGENIQGQYANYAEDIPVTSLSAKLQQAAKKFLGTDDIEHLDFQKVDEEQQPDDSDRLHYTCFTNGYVTDEVDESFGLAANNA